MSTNTLKTAAWIIIVLGILETLLFIYAINKGVSFSGGAFIYILIGIFLLKKGKIAYKLSQFIFTMLFLFIPAGLVMFFVMLFQVYTATEIPIEWGILDMNMLTLLVYIGVVCCLVMLLHHPNTREELSLDVYDSDIRTLYVPLKRVIIFPILFLVLIALLMGPHFLMNPYKPITAGMAKDKDIKANVGNVSKLELLSANTQNWHAVTVWTIYGDNGVALYRAVLDPGKKLRVEEYGRRSRKNDCAPKKSVNQAAADSRSIC